MIKKIRNYSQLSPSLEECNEAIGIYRQILKTRRDCCANRRIKLAYVDCMVWWINYRIALIKHLKKQKNICH